MPNIVIRGWSGSPPTSKMELFVTIIYWKHSTTVTKSSVLDDRDCFRREKLLNWIRWLFCETKTNFTKPGPLLTSKIELFVIIVDSWKLLTSVSSSLDPHWLNYNFQRTEEGCSNVNFVMVYVDGERPLFVFILNSKCNQDFNETILGTLSMSEKALKILLNIFGNVNGAGRLVWGQPSILK